MFRRSGKRRLLGGATALVTSLVLIVMTAGVVVGGTSSGDGVMTVTPNHAVAGATIPVITFDFCHDQNGDFADSSQVVLTIPAGWTAPTLGVGAGHIAVLDGGPSTGKLCQPNVSGISGSSNEGGTIDITMRC